MTKLSFVQLLLLLSLCGTRSFVNFSPSAHCDKFKYCVFSALTERQQQFWEDVEEGLDDIEEFYMKRGENIHRIRRFAMR